MNWLRDFVAWALRLAMKLFCRIQLKDVVKIPARGPLILYANHINSVEVPIMMSYLHPRPLIGFAKAESWRNPVFNLLFSLFKGIPVRRGEADLTAMQKAVQVVKDGNILAISPEGTRSYDGKLQKGLPGIILIAVRSSAPLQPMVYWGHESVWVNLKRLKRSDFNFKVGNPFTIDLHGEALSREVRQQVVDEVMFQMAALLPPDYRGVYSDLEKATTTYLRFEPGVASNLNIA